MHIPHIQSGFIKSVGKNNYNSPVGDVQPALTAEDTQLRRTPLQKAHLHVSAPKCNIRFIAFD